MAIPAEVPRQVNSPVTTKPSLAASALSLPCVPARRDPYVKQCLNILEHFGSNGSSHRSECPPQDMPALTMHLRGLTPLCTIRTSTRLANKKARKEQQALSVSHAYTDAKAHLGYVNYCYLIDSVHAVQTTQILQFLWYSAHH